MAELVPGKDGAQARDFDNGYIYLEDSDGNQTADSNCDANTLKAMISKVDAGAITGYATTWTKVKGTLENVATNLNTAIGKIEQHWQAPSADYAKSHLSKLRDTSSSLSGNCSDMGSGLENIGSAIQSAQGQDITDDSAPGIWGGMKGQINHGLDTMPKQVVWADPANGTPGPGPGPGPIGPGPGHMGGPGPGPVGPGPIGPGPKGPGPIGPGPSGPGPSGPGPIGPGPIGPGPIGPGPGIGGPGIGGPGIGGPGIHGGSGTTLASYDGGGMGPGLGGPGIGGPGIGGPGGGVAGGLAGPGAGLAGGSGTAGSSPTFGVGGAPSSMAGPGGGRSGTMAPMMGRPGGGSGNDEERERSTWLNEDDDVWGSSDAAPPVIDR